MSTKTSAAALIVATLATIHAHAQDIQLTGPLSSAPAMPFRPQSVPAIWEWAYWVSGGARLDPDFSWYAGVSAELTHGILSYEGLPGAIYRRGKLARAELRLGPWVGAATRAGGGLAEGGLTLDWGGIYHAPLGSLDVRGGVGYGAFGDERASYGVVTVAYGVRSALDRFTKMIPEPREPATLGMASVARLFLTYRGGFAAPFVHEWVLGVELSPTFLLPPYDDWRLLGAPPSSWKR